MNEEGVVHLVSLDASVGNLDAVLIECFHESSALFDKRHSQEIMNFIDINMKAVGSSWNPSDRNMERFIVGQWIKITDTPYVLASVIISSVCI